MLVRILIAVNVFLAALLVYAATRPNTLYFEHSIVIAAPPAKVFPLVNDFHHWDEWQPLTRDDPAATRTYSGAPSGVGAVFQWSGKGNTGSGRIEITQSVPDSRIAFHTDFDRPFKVHNENQFTFEPAGNGTRVTWTMQGSNLYIMKVMGVFLNMNRVIGKHFDESLRNLKASAEK